MAEGSKNNTLTIVLGVMAGISTAFAIYFGVTNANYLSDWKAVNTLPANKAKNLDLSMVKYLPTTF